MYPEHLVAPMRMDIAEGGFTELKSAAEVETVMAESGTTLMFINSVLRLFGTHGSSRCERSRLEF